MALRIGEREREKKMQSFDFALLNLASFRLSIYLSSTPNEERKFVLEHEYGRCSPSYGGSILGRRPDRISLHAFLYLSSSTFYLSRSACDSISLSFFRFCSACRVHLIFPSLVEGGGGGLSRFDPHNFQNFPTSCSFTMTLFTNTFFLTFIFSD